MNKEAVNTIVEQLKNTITLLETASSMINSDSDSIVFQSIMQVKSSADNLNVKSAELMKTVLTRL
jgi:hypothetical protein